MDFSAWGWGEYALFGALVAAVLLLFGLYLYQRRAQQRADDARLQRLVDDAVDIKVGREVSTTFFNLLRLQRELEQRVEDSLQGIARDIGAAQSDIDAARTAIADFRDYATRSTDLLDTMTATAESALTMLENTLLRAETMLQRMGQDIDTTRQGLADIEGIRRDLEALRHDWWFERNRSAADIAIQRFVQNIVEIRGYRRRAFLTRKTSDGALPLAVAYDIDGQALVLGCFADLHNGLVEDMAARVQEWQPFEAGGSPQVAIVTANGNGVPESVHGIQIVQAIDVPALLARQIVAAPPAT